MYLEEANKRKKCFICGVVRYGSAWAATDPRYVSGRELLYACHKDNSSSRLNCANILYWHILHMLENVVEYVRTPA